MPQEKATPLPKPAGVPPHGQAEGSEASSQTGSEQVQPPTGPFLVGGGGSPASTPRGTAGKVSGLPKLSLRQARRRADKMSMKELADVLKPAMSKEQEGYKAAFAAGAAGSADKGSGELAGRFTATDRNMMGQIYHDIGEASTDALFKKMVKLDGQDNARRVDPGWAVKQPSVNMAATNAGDAYTNHDEAKIPGTRWAIVTPKEVRAMLNLPEWKPTGRYQENRWVRCGKGVQNTLRREGPKKNIPQCTGGWTNIDHLTQRCPAWMTGGYRIDTLEKLVHQTCFDAKGRTSFAVRVTDGMPGYEDNLFHSAFAVRADGGRAFKWQDPSRAGVRVPSLAADSLSVVVHRCQLKDLPSILIHKLQPGGMGHSKAQAVQFSSYMPGDPRSKAGGRRLASHNCLLTYHRPSFCEREQPTMQPNTNLDVTHPVGNQDLEFVYVMEDPINNPGKLRLLYCCGLAAEPVTGWEGGVPESQLVQDKEFVDCLLYTSPSPRD